MRSIMERYRGVHDVLCWMAWHGSRIGVALELAEYVRAIVRGWWVVLVCVAAGLGGAVFVTSNSTPMYQGMVRFYVVSPAVTGQSALQSLELSRGKMASYASLVKSDAFIDRVVQVSANGLTAEQTADSVSASADSETLMLTVTVTQPDFDKARATVTAIAENFGNAVNELESGRTLPGGETVLNVVAGPAVLPGPVSPRVPLNLGLGILLGLAAGIVIAVSRRLLDKSLKTPEEVEVASGLPLLARLPYSHATSGRAALLLGKGAGSLLGEAARRLRTNIDHLPALPSAEVIAVTSARSREGKTTVALMLAKAWAEAGERVLLVEAHLRQPRLAADIGLGKSTGLSDVLAGHLHIGNAIQHTSVDGLHALAAGTIPANPTELLRGPALYDLLEEMRTQYTRVIVDAPALRPFSDAALIGAMVDGTLLVVRHGRVSAELLKAALKNLEAVNTHATGVVLNALPARFAEERRRFIGRFFRGMRVRPSRRRSRAAEWMPVNKSAGEPVKPVTRRR